MKSKWLEKCKVIARITRGFEAFGIPSGCNTLPPTNGIAPEMDFNAARFFSMLAILWLLTSSEILHSGCSME